MRQSSICVVSGWVVLGAGARCGERVDRVAAPTYRLLAKQSRHDDTRTSTAAHTHASSSYGCRDVWAVRCVGARGKTLTALLLLNVDAEMDT